MVHTIHFPKIAAVQSHRLYKQKQFLKLAHSLDKPIQSELKAFARAVWFAEQHPDILSTWHYRLRKEIQPGQAAWWIEKDIPPVDRYRCAAYRVELNQTATGENKLFLQSGRQKYPIDLNNLSTLHDSLLQAGSDPALIIPRRMGAAID